MTPLALAAERLEETTQPTPGAPPTTIAETGLNPDTLAQLMLKTLVAGETSGTQLAEKMRLPRKGTAGVLELPAGTLEASRTSLGHRVILETVSQESMR